MKTVKEICDQYISPAIVEQVMSELDAAGYVIVPKELSEKNRPAFNRQGNWHPDDTYTMLLWRDLANFMSRTAKTQETRQSED